MGLFSRRQEGDVSEPSINSDDAAPGSDSGIGPWDAAHAPERPGSAGRIDLGSLRIPAVDGMQIRLESPGGSSQEVSAAVLVLAGSTLELRAFAARAPQAFGMSCARTSPRNLTGPRPVSTWRTARTALRFSLMFLCAPPMVGTGR